MIKERLSIKINTSFENLKQLFQYINSIIKSTIYIFHIKILPFII